MSQAFHFITLALYGGATATYLAYLVRTTPAMASWAHKLITLGFISHILAIVHYTSCSGHLPITGMQELLSFMSLAIAGAFILFERRFKVAILGAFILPLVMLMLVASSLFPHFSGQPQAAPVAGMAWFHVLLALLSYAMFSIACGTGVMYLIQQHFLKHKHFGSMFHKLPSLETVDRISFQCLTTGFPLLTLAIIVGAVRSELVIERFLVWSDPRQMWTLGSWLLYAVLFYGRIAVGWRGRKAALLSIAGFILLCFTLVGSSHNVNWYP